MDRLKEKEIRQQVLREEHKQRDVYILTSLYLGNHLKEKKKKRAIKLLFLLDKELKSRIK